MSMLEIHCLSMSCLLLHLRQKSLARDSSACKALAKKCTVNQRKEHVEKYN